MLVVVLLWDQQEHTCPSLIIGVKILWNVEIGVQLKLTKFWGMDFTINQILWLLFCRMTGSAVHLVLLYCLWEVCNTRNCTENAQITFNHFLLPQCCFSLRYCVIYSVGLFSDIGLIFSRIQLNFLSLVTETGGCTIQFKNIIYPVYFYMNSCRNSKEINRRVCLKLLTVNVLNVNP